MAQVMKWGETVKVLLDVGFLANAFTLNDPVKGVLAGYTTTTTRINLLNNPNFETNTTGWTGVSGALTRITTASYIGTACARLAVSNAADLSARVSTSVQPAVGSGVTITASCYVYNFAGNNRQHKIRLRALDSGGTLITFFDGTATTVNVGAGWTRLSVTATTPALTASVQTVIFCQLDNGSLSNVTYVDAVLVEEASSALPYFDGTYAETYTGYELAEQAWNGTANASSSTATWGSDFVGGEYVLDGSTDFVDITEYVQSVNINRGRQTQLDTFNAGTLNIVADDKASGRQFDPLNTDSPWYQGALGIAPRRQVQVYGGTAGTAAMFSGYVFDLNIDYAEPQLSTASIAAVDALAQLSQTTLTAFNPPAELTSARVNTILNRSEVAWSTALRSISTGVATCGTVGYEDATNALAALQAVQFAEDGRLFADRSGNINFDARVATSFGTAVASLGGTAVDAIPILSLSNLYGAETVVNRATVQISGGTASSVANGTASQTEYGIKTFSLTDIPLDTAAAGSALATNLVSRFSEPEVRFSEASVLVNMLTAAQQEQIAALEIGDILSVTRVFTSGDPLTVTQSVVVESIQHRLSPARHEVNIGFGKIDLLTPFILDTSELDDADYALQ